MSGSLLIFSGIDGAGKSTQIDVLAQHLRHQGQRVHVIWSRGGYTPGIVLLKTAARKFLGKQHVPPAGPSQARSAALAKPHVRRCWLSLAILDLYLLYAIWIRLQRAIGTTVICDRYWHDTALDFELNFPDMRVPQWWLWRWLVRCSPRPDAAFMLLIPLAEAQRRSSLKNEPFPDSPRRLTERLLQYQQIVVSQPDWHVIDGRQSIREAAAEIRGIAGAARPQQEVSYAR